MPNSREKLYSYFNDEGYDLGTFEEFDAKMNTAESRKKLYDYLSNEVNAEGARYDLGTFEEFDAKIRGNSEGETPAEARPVSAVQTYSGVAFYTKEALNNWVSEQGSTGSTMSTTGSTIGEMEGIADASTAQAEDISITKPTAMTNNVSVRPVSAIQKGDGTPYSEGELKAMADSDATTQVADPTSAEIEAEEGESQKPKEEEKTIDSLAEDLKLQFGEAETAQDGKRASHNITLPEAMSLPLGSSYAGEYDAILEQEVWNKATGGKELSAEEVKAKEQELSNMSYEEVVSLLGKDGMARVEDARSRLLMQDAVEQKATKLLNRLVANEEVYNYLRQFVGGNDANEVVAGIASTLRGDEKLGERVNNPMELLPYAVAKSIGIDYLFGSEAMRQYLSSTPYETKAMTDYGMLWRKLYMSGAALPPEARTHYEDVLRDVYDKGELNTDVGEARMKDAINTLSQYSQIKQQFSEAEIAKVLAQTNKSLGQYMAFGSIEDAIFSEAELGGGGAPRDRLLANFDNYARKRASLAGNIGKLQELEARKAELNAESVEEVVSDYSGSPWETSAMSVAGMASSGDMQANIRNRVRTGNGKYARELELNDASITLREKAQDIIEHGERDDDFVSGVYHGLVDKAKYGSNWDFGMSNLAEGLMLKNIVDKVDKGEAITRDEEAFLDSWATLIAAESMVKQGRGYKAGAVTSEAIPFMVEMLLSPIKGGSSAASKFARWAIKKYGTAVARKVPMTITRYGVRLGGDVSKGVGMTLTTGIGRTADEAVRRSVGEINPSLDEEGNVVYGDHEKGEKVASAIAKAIGSKAIEYHSELVGEYFAPLLKGLTKLTDAGMSKIGLGKVTKFFKDVKASDWGKMVGEMSNRTQWHGTLGEFSEEIVGGIENAIIVGDQTLDTDERTGVFNKDNLIDTYLGVAVMGAMINGAQAMGYKSEERRMQMERDAWSTVGERLFGGKWNELMSQIDGTTQEDISDVVSGLMRNKDYNANQKKAILRYAGAVASEREMLDAAGRRAVDFQGERIIDAQGIVEEQEAKGFDAVAPDSRRAVTLRAIEAEEDIKELMGVGSGRLAEDALYKRYLTTDPQELLIRASEDESLSREQRDVIIDYLGAKAARDGMTSRRDAEVKMRTTLAHGNIDATTNKQSGEVIAATLKNGRKVVIVDGIVEANDDGSVSKSQTWESLVVIDEETGEKEMVSPGVISTIDHRIDADELKTITEGEIYSDVYTRYDRDVSGDREFAVGERVLLGKEKKEYQVTNVNDEYIELSAGNEVVEMPRGEVRSKMDQALYGGLEHKVTPIGISQSAEYEVLPESNESENQGGVVIAEEPMAIGPGVAVRVGGVAGVATSFPEDGKVIVETEDGKILPYDESEVEVVGETTETTGTTETTMSDGSNEPAEVDDNGRPFIVSSNGTTTFGEITEDTGLPSAPIKLSEGYQDENGKGYGLAHIEANHGKQIRGAGFKSVEEFVRFVAENYDGNDIRVGNPRGDGNITYLIQVKDKYDNTLFIELSRDGSYWNVNSGGVFRKGYSDKKETVVKTEPQQPNNAVSPDSSLSEVGNEGISTTEPNGESPVSQGEDSENKSDMQEGGVNSPDIPVDAKGKKLYEQAPIESTINAIYNNPDLDETEADALVAAKIAGATKRIAQLEKKKPKMGEDEDAYIAERAKWREQLEAEQASLAYWQGVQEAVPEMRRKERAKRQMEADIAQREREQQERAEQSRRAEERERNRGDYRKAIAGWEDTPSSFHEYVAQSLLVGNHKMRWNDNGSTRGLGSHTTGRRGVNRRGEVVTARNDESRAMGWLIEDRGGLSPEALADKLWNEYTGSYGEEMSEGSPLDVLLDVVTSMPTPQMMWDYVKGEHDARMKAEQGTYEEQYSAEEIEAFERDAMYREKYGVSEEEYWANEAQWDEFIESREMSAEELGNYDNFVAEERIKEEHGRRNQENAEDEQRTDNSESEGGVEVLSGTQPDITRGNEDVAGKSEGVDGNGVESNDVASEEAAELSEEDRQAIENMPIPTLKRQIKDTATTLFNVSQISDQWQAENKDKIERAKLLLAYAKQELARKERLKKSNKWGVKVGNTATPFDVVRKMFEEFNSNEDLAQLFEKVAKVFETLPIKVVFSDTIGGKSTQGWFSPTTGTLKLPGYFVYGGGISEQNKAETILHEMIHAVTTYALYINEKPYLQTELGFRLSDDMHAAIRQLKRIYASIANDKDFKGEYGAVSVHEMVAELSNVQFREKLKKKGLWETIVDAIKQLFGITPSNALEGAEAALEYMLNNFDRSQWEKMAGMGEKRGKQMRIGVDKMGSSFEYFTGTLTDLISIAKNAVKGLFKKNITPVSSRLVGDLKELGIDISEEYKHVVDNYAIRHTFNNHGGKGESLRGQIPINNSDFELIPDIVNNYDNITTIVTRKGLPGILYEKTFEDGTTVYVEEIHNKHKELTLVSMRKIKRPTLLGANRTNEPTPIPSSGKSSASKGSDNIGDVQGLEDYSAEELKEIAREYIEDVIAESGFDAEVVDLAIYGSRRRGDAREDSDLDIVVEYSGNAREDDLFNALNDAETQLEIDGVKVDINPITKSKSGTLGEFMERVREYDEGNESNGSTKESQPLTNPSAFGISPVLGEESEGSLEDDGLLFRDGDVTTSPLASGGELGTTMSTAEASTVGYSDAEVSMANDPIAKVMGKSQRSKKQQAKYAERERKYMRNRVAELAEKMHLDNVEVVESSQSTPSPQSGTPPKQGSGGELNASNGGVMSERKVRAKGWFDTRTGKIVINISNHLSVADVERTLLHEAVAHYGLRQLFGKQFDTFLDNVYLHADAEVRAQIIALAKKHGWDFRTATEEYLAGLAEDTNFEYLEYQTSFWMKIKRFFMDMLESIGWDYKGPELSDNELRYLLWRSYENMVNPGRHRSILGKAEDVAKQYALGVGNYSADAESMSQVAESGAVMVDNQGNPIDEDGKLIVEQVSSIDEITDADFDLPTRSIQLPSIPPKVDEAIGANGKPIVIKKNVFEKNKKSHKDLTPKDSRAILINTLYSPDLYGQNQKITRPYNWILIHLADTNTAVLVEVNENKDNVEIVNWHYINDDAIERKKKQAIREGGLILTLESAAADTSNFLPSADKGTINLRNTNELGEKIAEAESEVNTNPTDKQKEAGNYKKGHVKVGPFNITIEQPKGSVRRGVDADGNKWETEMQNTYGYIRGTEGVDGDHIDVFLSDDIDGWDGHKVFVVDQRNADGSFDEHKVMLGFNDINDAEAAYMSNYEEGWQGLGAITGVAIEEFGKWIASSHRKTKAFAEYKSVKTTEGQSIDEGILFRDGESDGTREEYNRRVRRPNRSGSVGKWDNLGWRMKEAYQDSMLSLKELQEVIAKKYGLKEIPSWMNAYLQENLMSSRNKAASDVYMRDFYNPMMKEVQALIKKGVKYEDLVNYMIAKHGLERNVVMAERDAKRAADEAKKKGEDWQKTYDEALKENREQDYSGLTALTGEESVMTAEKVAEKMVEKFEGAHETDALWEKVNAATKETLRKSYEGGLMSKETYESTDAMYEHYIPLRGWDSDIASDVYEYLMSDRPLLSPALKTAKGRTSLADDPIATIGMMADSTIAQANRNKMKQAFYYFAVNNPSDVVTISKQWYVYDEVTKKWQPRSADIPLDASSEEIATIVEEFEARMEELARDGKAKRKSQGLDLDLRTVGREGEEHTVRVKVNGEEYCIYVNGSPRAAQALNGLTNPEMFNDALMKGTKKVNNYLAQVFTSKNPEFVFSNMSRDLMWATGAVAVKENAKYNVVYHKNINKIFWSGTMPRLVHRHMMGTLNMNNELDRYFEEFVRHGGETGYTAINSIEHYKRNIKRSVKDAQGKRGMTKKAWNGVFDAIEFMNRSAENMTRFAVYVTSREMGRDQARAAHDAKEITVNFNKKGSGELGARYLGGLYVFMNACIQSMANFARLTGKHPVKMTGALATMAGLGFMLPLLNRMLAEAMGDDDEYWNLPEWVRRNNLVFRIPGTNKFITLPISHELRPFYGIGEIAYSVMNEKEDAKEGLGKAVLGFSGMSPIDFTGNGGNVAVNLTPTAFQPVAQLIANVDYFGKPIFKDADYLEDYPEYTKAYKGTSPMLVSGTEFLNRVSGGDVVVAGGIDLTPDVIEHLVESYFGGAGKTVNKAIKGFSMIWDEDTREIRNIPIVNKFLQTAEERTYGSHTQKEFYEAMDKVEDTGHKLSGYGKQATMGSIEYAEKLNELINSPEYKEYKLAMGYKSAIKKLQNSLGNIDKTKEKEVSEAIQRLQKEMLEELPKTKAQDIDTVLDNAEEVKWGAEEKVETIFKSSIDDYNIRKDAVNDAKEYGDTTALKKFIESGRGKDNK